jgi:lactoylglutathione lyase
MALARVRVRVPTRAFVPRARARARMTTARASLSSYLPSDTYRSLPKDGDVTFLHTMIRAKDLERTMSFFAALGLRETRRKDSDKGKFTLVFMASAPGAPEIEITHNWPDENGETETFAPPSRSMGHLAFAVDDAYAKCAELQNAGIVINRPPRDGRMAFVISPDGISVELLQKGDALAPAEPWASMQNVGSW